MQYRNRHHLSLSFCLLSSSVGWVPVAQADDSFGLGRIETVEVRADRVLPAAPTATVNAATLREENRETVTEAVDRLPGVTAGNFGARNEQTVFVRGFDMRQVPVFIDGIPVYVPYDGYVDLGRFTTFDLAEINVSKGFASVLYGPNTLGGAINLVTRRPQQAFEGEVGAGYNSGERVESDGERVWANLGTNQGSWYGQLGTSWVKQDAFALSDDFDPVPTEDGGLRENSYRKDAKVSFKLAYTPNAEDEYALGYVNQQGEKGTPPYAGTDPSVVPRYWQWPYWDKESLYLVSRTGLGNDSYLKARLYYDILENSLYSYDDATYTAQTRRYAFKSWYDDFSYGGSVEYGIPLGAHLLKAAAHYKLDNHEEHNAGEPIRTFEDTTTSLALEDTITLSSAHYVVAGISYDMRDSVEAESYVGGAVGDFPDNDTDAWNPQIGYFTDLTEQDEARLTLSRKTRFANIKDRYSQRMGSAIPNPDLEPEIALTTEIGWVHRFGDNLTLDTAVFYSDIQALIQQVNITPSIYQLQNVGEVDSSGLEISLDGRVADQLALGGNYTYLQRDNKSSDLKLTDVPDHKLYTYVTWHLNDALSFSATAQYESERYSSTDGARKADGFTVAGLRATYAFEQGLTARIGAENVADENYAYQEGYPEPGRNWYANLSYDF